MIKGLQRKLPLVFMATECNILITTGWYDERTNVLLLANARLTRQSSDFSGRFFRAIDEQSDQREKVGGKRKRRKKKFY